MTKEIEIIIRLVVELSGQSFTVAVQSETVDQQDKPLLLRQIDPNSSDWFTVECPFCEWENSYEKKSNARRALSAHARQLHRGDWQRHKVE